MALPSEAQIRAAILQATEILEATLDFGASTSPNFIAESEALHSAVGAWATSEISSALGAVDTQRRRLAAIVSPGAARPMLDPLWHVYADVLGIEEGAIEDRLDRIREVFDANADSVNSRDFTFATASAGGSNVGDGLIQRCTVDEYGEPIEAAHAESKSFVCVSDQNSTGGGQRHEEVFEVRGAPLGDDELDRAGSGILVRVQAVSARNSMLKNASWDAWRSTTNDATALTSIPNWTVDTIANVEADATNFYRTEGGRDPATPYGMKLTGAVVFSQSIQRLRGRIDPTRPVYLQVAYNRAVGSGTGRLVLAIGSTSVNVTLSAQAGWNILRVPLDVNAYLATFDGDDTKVTLTLDTTPTGYTVVDDIILTQPPRIDGTMYVVVGGATPFMLDDSFTIGDSASDATIIQKWLWRVYGRWLPSATGGTETWANT